MESKNEQVQSFLDDMQGGTLEQYEILQALRAVVFQLHPGVSERIIYGGIMFTLEDDFGGLFPSKHHVSFEFSQGFMLKDEGGHLEGTGKFRRHLKIKSLSDIEDKQVAYYVGQIG